MKHYFMCELFRILKKSSAVVKKLSALEKTNIPTFLKWLWILKTGFEKSDAFYRPRFTFYHYLYICLFTYV